MSWWRHQMETFSALLALCAGNSPVPVNSPHKSQWRGALVFSLICARINDWVNNRQAGDLRRHCGHYDVNVMCRQEGPVTFTWRKFHKEYPQPSETKIILNITYLIFIQVCRGSMSNLNIHIESGNYRLWNRAFLRRVNIQWNWPTLSCHHCSSHLIMTQQVVSPVSYDTCMAGQ